MHDTIHFSSLKLSFQFDEEADVDKDYDRENPSLEEVAQVIYEAYSFFHLKDRGPWSLAADKVTIEQVFAEPLTINRHGENVTIKLGDNEVFKPWVVEGCHKLHDDFCLEVNINWGECLVTAHIGVFNDEGATLIIGFSWGHEKETNGHVVLESVEATQALLENCLDRVFQELSTWLCQPQPSS